MGTLKTKVYLSEKFSTVLIICDENPGQLAILFQKTKVLDESRSKWTYLVKHPSLHSTIQPCYSLLIVTSNIVNFLGEGSTGGHPTSNFPVKVGNKSKNKMDLFKGMLVQHRKQKFEINWRAEHHIGMESLKD